MNKVNAAQRNVGSENQIAVILEFPRGNTRAVSVKRNTSGIDFLIGVTHKFGLPIVTDMKEWKLTSLCKRTDDGLEMFDLNVPLPDAGITDGDCLKLSPL